MNNLANQNTPTAASLLIDALAPKHRALLYTALRFYKAEMQEVYADHYWRTVPQNEMQPKIFYKVGEAMRWAEQESEAILKTLFADCVHEDLDVTAYAFKEVQAQQNELVQAS